MAIRIEPYTTEAQAAAVRAFNCRLREGGETEFLLGESPPQPGGTVIRNQNYLALEGDVVRGGFLLAEYPAGFGDGSTAHVLNCREPLSEAIVDPRYSLLALQLLKYMTRQGPYLFALGMGSESRPFPRLLKSAGWTILPVPFLFRVIRAGRFLRELKLLQSSPARRTAARMAALTGAGKAAISVLQYRAVLSGVAARGLSLERVSAWGEWVDELWAECRARHSFAVSRDGKTVRELYPLGSRFQAYLLRRDGRPVAWMSAINTQMQNHKYFGNLRVATLLDGVALPGEAQAAIALTSRAVAREGADLVVTNQSHAEWVSAFRGAGYLSASSNYILALSPKLAEAIGAQPGGTGSMHFTRGDSDGPIHL